MMMAMTPSHRPAEPSSSDATGMAPVVAMPAVAAGAAPGSATVTAAEGPGSVGPLSGCSSPGLSGGAVHGLTLPSA